MAIDLLNIEPTTISRDLRDKFVLLYGLEKSGKTSWAAKIPDNLLLATEIGYHAIGGIKAVDITKWSDFKLVLRQLEKPEVMAMYKTITIDTVAILYNLCEKYICSQADVTKIGDIPWGAGYKTLKDEFSDGLRKITLLGYGLIMLAHAEIKPIKIDDETTIDKVNPLLDKRPLDIVNQLVDIIGYIEMKFDNEGNCTRSLITRRTATIVAGSRFKYLPSRIPFGYNELVDALSRAIEMSGSKDGASIVDLTEDRGSFLEDRPFSEVQEEAHSLWVKLVEKNTDNAAKILDMVQKIFNERKKLSDITENQKDLFELLLIEMRSL